MKKKSGFTLVELLVTIVLLGVVTTVIIFNVTNVSKNSKKTEYERFVASIKSSASVYADMNPEAFQDLYVNKAFLYITVGNLIDSGLVDEKLKNPYTDEKVKRDEIVKASLDTTTEALTFEYPIDKSKDTKTEVFMVAIDDYVVWGEPYDCMQGLGSYRLALSDEEGNLITDVNTLKNDYHLACSMPNEFQKTNDNRYQTTESGNYDVTYTWLTKSGIKKSFTRTLRVNSKVTPGFKTYYDGVETNYDFDDLKNGKMWATPEYVASENRWKYLTYKPYIEGADEDSTAYSIKVQSIDPLGQEFYVAGSANNLISDFTTVYDAYEGNILYTLKTLVKGHYDKNYSYDAEGKYNMRQKLVLPKQYVSGDSTNWTTDKTFTIADKLGTNNTSIYSKFGIAKFEYRLANEGTEMNNSIGNDARYTFNKVANGNTVKNIDVRYPANECKEKLKYTYVYVRPINNNGFVGEWVKLDGYLTNQVDLLVLTNMKTGGANGSTCTDCNSCCKAEGGEACYYCNKNFYVNINGHNFVILERDNQGYLFSALNAVTNKCVNGSVTTLETWGVQTCDGYFTGTYNQTTATQTEIIKEATNMLSNISASKYFESYTLEGQTVKVGTFTADQFKKYTNAIFENANTNLWTVSKYTEVMESKVSDPYPHGNSTTYNNSYYYIQKGSNTTQSYYGACNQVKPAVKLKTIYTCGGNGTASNPYTII